MLPESVLAEFSIDDLSDNRQQMLPVKTRASATQQIHSRKSYSKTPQGYNVYKHRVVLEMYSPSESSSELLKNSGKPTKQLTHLSEEYYSYKAAAAPPECVPFRWPGVRKSEQIEGKSRGHDQYLMPPSAYSASATILPPSNIARTSSGSPKENEGYFSWNLSQSTEVFERSLQGEIINDYDGDHYEYDYEAEDIMELDAHEAECFPMSGALSLELPGSPSLIPATKSNNPDPVSIVNPSFVETSQSDVAPGLKLSAPLNSLLGLCIDNNSGNKVTNSAEDEDHSVKNSSAECTTTPFSPARMPCTNSFWGVCALGKCCGIIVETISVHNYAAR